MHTRRTKWMKRISAMTIGVMLINVSDCLPKNYWYQFAGAGRTAVLDAFAELVFTTITDTLFPLPEDDTSPTPTPTP